MSFKNLGLSADLLAAIADQGYDIPTPVQQQAIPAILNGTDLMVSAQTGTGKTAGYTLPMLQRLNDQRSSKDKMMLRALILTPTRELAAQVAESVKTYGRHMPFKTAVIYGGVGINPQIKALRQGVNILIATPGRLLDLVGQKAVNLSNIEILVLDEADRMMDMGFITDIRRIITLLPKTRQNLLFSATFSDPIKKLAAGLMNDPKMIEITRRNAPAESVNQLIYPVDNKRKSALLSHLIASEKWGQVLVFTRTKHGANKLTLQLEKDGIKSTAIHGNKSQAARSKALADFKKGFVQVLVATDIAARGLDIDQLPYVVNFELPHCPEDYIHRIGRTGRAGNSGEAVSLVCIDEHKLLKEIQRLLKRDIPQVTVPGYEPDPTIKAEPIFRGRMQQQSRGKPQGSRPRYKHATRA